MSMETNDLMKKTKAELVNMLQDSNDQLLEFRLRNVQLAQKLTDEEINAQVNLEEYDYLRKSCDNYAQLIKELLRHNEEQAVTITSRLLLDLIPDFHG